MHRQFTLISSRARKKAPVHIQKEATWVRQLAAGEPTAWTQLVDSWSPRLYSYVLYNVATEDEAQALLHLIFADIVQTVVGSLRAANLTVLIFSVAHQHVVRHRQQTSDAFTGTKLHPLPTSAAANEQMAAFLDTFRRFTLELQQILLLHYLCGVSLSDVAQIVGQSEEFLTKILYRVKLTLS